VGIDLSSDGIDRVVWTSADLDDHPVREADDRAGSICDGPLMDANLVRAGGGLDADLAGFYQDHVVCAAFACDCETVGSGDAVEVYGFYGDVVVVDCGGGSLAEKMEQEELSQGRE